MRLVFPKNNIGPYFARNGHQEVILLLFSDLMRPPPWFCIQLWDTQHKKNEDLLEWVQSRDMKTIRGWAPFLWESLREFGLYRLEKQRLQGVLVEAFQHIKEPKRKMVRDYIARTGHDRTRRNVSKWKEGRFRLEKRKKFFTVRVVRQWKRFPREAMDVPSLQVLQARLSAALRNLVQWKVSADAQVVL